MNKTNTLPVLMVLKFRGRQTNMITLEDGRKKVLSQGVTGKIHLGSLVREPAKT